LLFKNKTPKLFAKKIAENYNHIIALKNCKNSPKTAENYNHSIDPLDNDST
jgi:hypothetical protein